MLINYVFPNYFYKINWKSDVGPESKYKKFNMSRLKTALSSLKKSLANLVRKETFYQYFAVHTEHIIMVTFF